MRIPLQNCPMVVSNQLKFLFAKYDDVKVVLAGGGSRIRLLAIYKDWQGNHCEVILGTF